MGTKRQIFYSFHYDNDVFRVQQIRNIGALEDNKPVSANDWETVKKGGDKAIEKWIDDTMKGRSCLVVLVGSDTSKRKWVDYEIRKAWDDGKGVLGIYIDDLVDPRYSKTPPFFGKSLRGTNPFNNISLKSGKVLSSIVKCYAPPPIDTYKNIAANLETWIEEAIKMRQ
ncbi:MAG: hypothetical protein UU48_C0021G0004 [Candidatus Uhrbacteria bacterium GW2011_GWF2_41_16]|uniref:Thoeris protein ThsB TIR-like domain-containing protein n=1 Tax=Candidatus Uhrbacteria bacterium GW2011_GWF2_41_16 TaxID=1618997 RepID=A0A0G0V7L1_9BACT|nr:MAG: hypothetical protein UU48_C0021G0004 [Candidatus Uhrbacteria bacterium GW2011_GWF2_41_16]